MPTILITGCNRGIGLELVRQYAADGWRVLATCRDPARADELRALPGDVAIHALDVADPASVDALAAVLSDTPLDVLLNNAALMGPQDARLQNADYAAWAEVFATNTMGVFKVTTAFAPHLLRGTRRLVVAISSRQGSIGLIESPERVVYRSSKAALNAVVKALSLGFRDQGIAIVALSPGWVRTRMTGMQAALSPEQSVNGLRAVIARLGLSDSGRFLGLQGEEIGW